MEIDGISYLFDAGEPCTVPIITNSILNGNKTCEPKVQAPNVDIDSIRSIFISHFHVDHVGGLPLLIQALHFCQKRGYTAGFKNENSLRVYLPNENIKLFEDLLRALSLEKLNYELKILPIKEEEFYVDKAIKVSAFRTTHLKTGHSYSFLLEAEEKRIAYSGDLGNEYDVLSILKDGADLAIIECTHVIPENLFQVLSGKNISKLVLNHLHYRLYGREKEIESLSRRYLNCDTIVASDNLELFV